MGNYDDDLVLVDSEDEQPERQFMGTMPCRHCGKQIAGNCTKCPHCGGTFGLDSFTTEEYLRYRKAERKANRESSRQVAGCLLVILAIFWLLVEKGLWRWLADLLAV